MSQIVKLSVFVAISLAFVHILTSADIVTWEEVKALEHNTTVLLIDVRQPQELAATGVIPGSINIPLNILEDTLVNLPPEDFERIYQREKPQKNTPLVFTCQSGNRSAQAQNLALNLGFLIVKNYAGGWLDWVQHLNNSK